MATPPTAIPTAASASAAPTVAYVVTSQWDGGFQAQITISNPASGSAIDGWRLTFVYDAHITDIWDATIVGQSDGVYTIAAASYNAAIPSGASATFGFNAAPPRGSTCAHAPSRYAINGVPVSPSGGGGEGASSHGTPTLAISSASVAAPSAPGATATLAFPVALSAPSASVVTVDYATANGTASAPADYVATSGTLRFAPGQTVANVLVTIPAVASASSSPSSGHGGGPSLHFTVSLHGATGATIAGATATGTIGQPVAAPVASATFAVTTDWGSGYGGQITVSNGSSTQALSDWTVQFTYTGAITNIWDATIASQSGTRFTIAAAPYDATIAPGASTSFGFNAAPGNVTSASAPSSLVVVGGVWSGGATVAPASPPRADNIDITAVQGQVVVVDVLAAASNSSSGGALSLASAGPAQHGSVAANLARGTVAYTAPPVSSAYVGPDSFSYTVSDGRGATATGTVFVAVAAYAPPVAGSGSVATSEGTPVVVPVLSYARDADGYPLSLIAVGTPQHGSATIEPSSGAAAASVTYAPAAGYTGADSFTYTVSDGHGGSATGTVTVLVERAGAVPGAWPARVLAPYVDSTLYPLYDIAAAAQATGAPFFTLAFVVAGPHGEPAWGGYEEYDVANLSAGSYSSGMQAKIRAVRAMGGDVSVSFGGAANLELALVVSDPTALQAAYQSVISTYALTHCDWDIEGAALGDTASIDTRSQAIAGLQAAAAASGTRLVVSFTLPVLPTGLLPDALYVLRSAIKYGVQVGYVNPMAFDFGSANAPHPATHMGTYAIQSVTSVFGQLQALYGTSKTAAQLWAMMGCTVMIGYDDLDELFTLADAQQLLAFAQQQGMGLLTFWDINRDEPGATPSNTSSGVNSAPFQFTYALKAFTSSTPSSSPTTPTTTTTAIRLSPS